MIQQVAGQLHLTSHFVDAAHRLYILAVHHHFTQGRRTAHVVAACLYIVCRREKSPHLLIDFAEALQANLYTLGACFLKFTRMLMLNLPIIDPSLYIHRFAARMELGESTHTVSMTALRLVARMKRDWIQTGRRPAGICGACLLIASRVHGFRRTRQEIMHIVRVTDITLRNRLAEFENTPASLLSAEEFDKLDNLEEADPPSYTRGLLDEAFAREAALLEDAYNADMNDDTLRLENGGDNTGTATALSGSHAGGGYFDPNAINVSAGTVPVNAAKALIDRPAITMLMDRSHILDAEIAVSNANMGVSSTLPVRTLADGSVEGNSHILGGDDRTVDDLSVDGSRSLMRGTKASSRYSMASDVGSDIPLNHGVIEAAVSTPLLTPEEQLLWKAKTLLSKNWGSAVGKFRNLLAEREREALANQEQTNKENIRNPHKNTNDAEEEENDDEEEEEELDSDALEEKFVRRSRLRGNAVRGRSGRLIRGVSSRRNNRARRTSDSENEEASDNNEEKTTTSRTTRSSSKAKSSTPKPTTPSTSGFDRRQKKSQIMYTELAADMAQNLQAGGDTAENMRAKSASFAAALSSKAIETAQELINRNKDGVPSASSSSSSKYQRKQKSTGTGVTDHAEEDDEEEDEDDDLALVVHPTLGNSTRTTLPADPEIYERSRKLLARTVSNIKESTNGPNQSSSLQGPRYDVSDIATAEVIAAANKDFEMPILDNDDTVVVIDDNTAESINQGKSKSRTGRSNEKSTASSSSSSSSNVVAPDDVDFYVLPSTEAMKRKDIWNSIYENYLKEREEKKKADSQVYRKLRPGSSRSSKGGATVTEAVGNLLSAPRLSKKLNYAAMKSLGNLFAEETGEGGNNEDEITHNDFDTNLNTVLSSSSTRTAAESRKGTGNNMNSSGGTAKDTKKRTNRANTEDFDDDITVESKPLTAAKRSKVSEPTVNTATVKAPTIKVTAPTVKTSVKSTAPPTVKATTSVKVISPAGNIGPATTTLSSSSSSVVKPGTNTGKTTTTAGTVPVSIAKPGSKQIPPVVATKTGLSNSKLPPSRSAIPIAKPKTANKKQTEDLSMYDDNEEFVSETNKWGKSRRDDQGDDDGGHEDYD